MALRHGTDLGSGRCKSGACACVYGIMALAIFHHGARASSMKSAARGMQRELDSENKGFQMLKRMGWQSGAIGQSQDGLVEPIDPLANPNALTSPRRSGIGNANGYGFEGNSGRSKRKLRGGLERRFDMDAGASSPSRTRKNKVSTAS